MSDTLLLPDRRRPEPLWHQVEQAIRARIAQNLWPPGSQLPAEDKLCEMLGVSRITLRHAMRNLEASGVLRREHGRGTFVRNATLVAGARGLTSFTDEMALLGLSGGSRILDKACIPASPEAAAALAIEPGEPVARIRRLRLGDGLPIGVQDAHLRLDRAPGILEDELAGGSLYAHLRQRYGIVPFEATETYRVAAAATEEADLLGIPPGSPAFMVERITVDDRGPFEFTVSTMRGDRYEIRSTLRSTHP
ncbi:GntR family transcriptional regulator [Mycobacterium sp. KBS0706]|uniref:GntR family transcriptional regulator n=1 Tax=Mycobacterium sp. KBS0706 TaxID=2578109 RepID=UPI00117D6764|nr:GntR family transcriptional regulator [Mycobacterium sp. KBS0706]TSD84761.1 GntR family transcriptional regulator [Mycobacterium sp. KBS0706]